MEIEAEKVEYLQKVRKNEYRALKYHDKQKNHN
jgi:hypothetical protein